MLRTTAILSCIVGGVGRIWTWLAMILNRFASNRQGVIGLIFVLALIPLLAAGGAAVDLSRAYLVKQRLGAALDAAGLAVGTASGATDAELNTLMLDYFNANYPASEIGVPATPIMRIEDSEITITATADVDTTLMRIVNIDTITVAASTTIIRETTGLEVVLVLDNTGSMFGAKLNSLKEASRTFVDIVFGDETEPDFLKVGIVPFAGAVNVGTNINFGDTYTTNNPPDDSFIAFQAFVNPKPGKWRGCVEARVAPFDTTDDSQLEPNAGGGKWERYLFPDNNFSNPWFFLNNFNHPFVGPNKFCPVELLPLTNNKQNVLDKINEMIANGVTHINLGAVWGWRVISPSEPYTAGVAYDNDEYNKAIIIMTDGSNFISSSFGQYSGYGKLPEGKLGTTNKFVAQNELDNRLTDVCTKIKAEGILVYTIVFQLFSTSIQNLMRNCATDSGKFYNSPSGADLESAFRAIGAELSNLRIGR